MKKVLFLFLFILLLTPLYAQDAEVSGIKISEPTIAQEALWDVLLTLNADSLTGILQNYGVVFTGTNYIISAFNAATLWRLDQNGNLIGSFTPTGSTIPAGQGMRDMEYANGFLWGGANSNILYKFDLNTNAQVGTLTLPAGTVARGCAYDPVRDGFWVSTFGGNITCYSATTGAAIPGAVLVNADAGKHGLAYDDKTPGGPWLWVSIENSQPTNMKVSRYNLSTLTLDQSWIVETQTVGAPNVAPGGLHISDDLVPGKLVMISLAQGNPDRISVYEIAVLDAGPLNPFNLTAPASGTTVTTFPGSTTPVTITWDTANANANYKWIFGSPTVPPRLLELPASTNSLTLTLGQIDAILAGLSVPQGGSVVGQWDVWAYRNNAPAFDSLKASNGPFAITLARGIPSLTPFNLVNPPNGTTLVTSVFNNNPVTINWTRSGAGVTYKWKFGVDVVANPILTVPSGNGGLDSSITLINSAIDGILAGLGLNPGDSVVGQWAVWAYSGNDSLKSAQTFAITLKRQAKGDVLIAYDSTLTNGRISRDSVAAVLARNNITYDLFNKGGNTSTSAITLRGYKKVYWLGEGTSVMSNVQKDSIKAYLNSGTPTSKSNLIIFSEDVGYMLGRAASTYYDLDFVNNYLGWNFLLDRPATGANQGLIGLAINPGVTDSTIGPWPDVLGLFGTTSEALYRFRYDPTAYSAIGNKTANFEVATFGVDVESLRPAIDSPPGSPVERMVMAAYNYLVIPVELSAFTANAYMNTVRLEWSTASELNNRGFEVERRLQGQEYQKIGFVEGKGTTTETQHYSFTDARLSSGTYSYRLKQIDFDGTVSYSSSVEVEIIQPVEFSLSQNYPNPFNPTTTIQFSLPMNSRVELKIFNVLGQEVRTLLNREMESGYHEINFDASELSSGVYFYKLETTAVNGMNNSAVKKMILTK